MGYYISNINSEFKMKAENKEKALAAIKKLFDPETINANARGGRWGDGEKQASWYSWVDTEKSLACETVEDAIGEWGWETRTDEETGDIIDMYFPENKMGQEEYLFQAIAPFVEEGSYFHMVGEDDSQWRWYFNGKDLEEQYIQEIIWK
jgi:hypothetical protein